MDAIQPRLVLNALKARSESLFGDADAAFEPVAIFHRPYSTVFRLRVAMAHRVPAYVFVKIYKARPPLAYETPPPPAEVVREEFVATTRLHEALEGRPGLSSPRPIVSLPEHGAIVTQELIGAPLDRALRCWRHRRRPPTLEAIATRIGAWLRAYQRSGDAAGPWSVEDARAYLDDRLRYIAPLLGEGSRPRALAVFDRLAADLPSGPEPLVPIHADLCPGNIMVTPGGGVAVLDFATAQAGTRYHDVAHLFLHLELARRRARRRGIDIGALQTTLLAVFDRPDAAEHPLFRLMLLQHIVCHVTQLVDCAGWGSRFALRALARWRWRICLALPMLTSSALAA